MSLQSIYEQDKERLVSSLSGKTRVEAVRVMETELDRVLYEFNDSEDNERVRETANALIQTAKAGAGMIDTDGVTRIYGRTDYPGGDGSADGGRKGLPVIFWVLLALGLAGAVSFAAVFFYTQREAEHTTAWYITAIAPFAAMVLLFIAGLLARKQEIKKDEKLHAEVLVDPMKVYNHLLAVILVIDKQLEEARSLDTLRERQQERNSENGPDPAELTLLSQLLEDAYARRGSDDQAEETISQIRFYLHQKQIDTIDWSEQEESGRHWFDMIPAYEAGTLRPALVRDGRLMKKGLASEGRRM